MSDNVVSIFSKKKEDNVVELPTTKEVALSVFEAIMKKNKENEERVRKDRAQHNANVTRSYRLKNRKK